MLITVSIIRGLDAGRKVLVPETRRQEVRVGTGRSSGWWETDKAPKGMFHGIHREAGPNTLVSQLPMSQACSQVQSHLAQIAMATWPKMEAEGQKDLPECVILQKTQGLGMTRSRRGRSEVGGGGGGWGRGLVMTNTELPASTEIHALEAGFQFSQTKYRKVTFLVP